MKNVTQILHEIEKGHPGATDELLPLVYGELRRLAAAKMAQENPGHSLSATSLVHEAYLRLVENEGTQVWNSRAHFFAAAAEAIRRLLIESARRRQSQRRGGDWERAQLSDFELPILDFGEQLLAINDVLDLLALEDAQAAELVKLRFFTGMSIPEAATALGIARSTAYDLWKFARAWLQCALREEI